MQQDIVEIEIGMNEAVALAVAVDGDQIAACDMAHPFDERPLRLVEVGKLPKSAP